MAESDTNLQGAALLVELDRTSSTPAHVQLEGALRDAIRSGRLLGDAVLPATRRLADELGLSRGVVVEAYQQLTVRGLPDRADRRLHPRRTRARERAVPARAHGTAGGAAPPRRPPCHRLHLRASRRLAVPARRLAAHPAHRAHRGPERPARLPRRARRARAARRARRVPQPRARHLGDARRRHRVQRLRAGDVAAVPGAGRARRCGGSPSRIRATPTRARPQAAPGSRSSASRSPRAASMSTRSRAVGRRGGARHAGPPVPDRRRALARAPRRPARLGTRARRPHHRGRLRRRAPLRPHARRCAAWPGARPRRLRRARPARPSPPACASAG